MASRHDASSSSPKLRKKRQQRHEDKGITQRLGSRETREDSQNNSTGLINSREKSAAHEEHDSLRGSWLTG
jgi:hypothetical protein